MEHIDTEQMAEEQVSDAPNAGIGNEASQQVNSTVVSETATAEPVDPAAVDVVAEDTASEPVEVIRTETRAIVEEGDDIAFVDETVTEMEDENGNIVTVDETITDVIHADGSETITDEIVTTVVDEAGDVAIVDETITAESYADGDTSISDEIVTDVILADGSETITDQVVAVAEDDAGDVAIVSETMVAEIDAEGDVVVSDETVTDVIRADGSEVVTDEIVTAAADEAGDVVIVDETVAVETDAEGDVVMQAEALEVAVAEGRSGEQTTATMADFVGDFEFKPLKSGETRDGIIVSVSTSEILVDVGAKSEGFILQREMERHGREYAETYEVGDSVVVYVVRPEDRDGNVVLSLARAQQERDWREAERLLEESEVFESQVIGHNRGGVICRVGKVRGFVPASQLVTKPEAPPDADEENRWAGLVGENLWLKVVEMDRKRNRLILSERLASRERRRDRKSELMSELKKGDVRKGRISSLAKFGAFVDLGGADGLIHLSELSWSRVNHPSEVVSPGQTVEVYVLNVDRERKRIGLSLRRLTPEPWSVVHEKYAVGQIVDGVITKLANFGAFARVDGTIEGLIHISELANHRVTHPREVVKEGEELKLRIVRIDPARKRMGLSLKRVEDEAYAEVDWRAGDDDDGDVDWVDGDDFDD